MATLALLGLAIAGAHTIVHEHDAGWSDVSTRTPLP
jgi:hypothetical protein